MAQAVQSKGGHIGDGKSAGYECRMIAIDLDGTLLSPTGHVTPRVRQAVLRAVEAGLVICFATGRNWTESRAIVHSVGHYDLAVFVGGAMVVDTRRDVTLHRTMMHPVSTIFPCWPMPLWAWPWATPGPKCARSPGG